MRSQKINNRAPRPFNNQNASGRWAGGQGGFIPAPKFPQPVKKADKDASSKDGGESKAQS
ncbi:hypothetical protein [Brevifollis gellanilyticus]|uniref:Uncharacterized protein n=1 Tax=Brevifollis gellanilyticus TaxID=748831 RepID=A0A512MHU0_9BACT|nr:hypothetical protein [Brevifollis gellanilyticus]GEP46305.1 hypothetical protein BGE01nite_55960 [Brevifollis gellanilyticus]